MLHIIDKNVGAFLRKKLLNRILRDVHRSGDKIPVVISIAGEAIKITGDD